jgi:hypothetical protein
MATAIQTRAITKPAHKVISVNPIQARWMYALPRSPMNNLSPLVVEMGKNPFLSTVGERTCQTVMEIKIKPIVIKKMAVGIVHAIHSRVIISPFFYTRPMANPFARLFLTNQITRAPGTIVRIPAAASSPQSSPEALTVRVMVAAMGFAFVVVNVLASKSSTQENMKQKKAVTPMPARIWGIKMVKKNLGNLYPSMNAVSSISRGTPDMNPSRIHTARGTLKRQCARATAMCVSIRPNVEYN